MLRLRAREPKRAASQGDPEGTVLWEVGLPRLPRCADLAITLDGEYAAQGSEYPGFCFVGDRGYVEGPIRLHRSRQ